MYIHLKTKTPVRFLLPAPQLDEFLAKLQICLNESFIGTNQQKQRFASLKLVDMPAVCELRFRRGIWRGVTNLVSSNCRNYPSA